MAHIAPRLIDEEAHIVGPLSMTVEQLRIANEDVEGLFRGFTGPEAAATAAIGAVVGVSLLKVETGSQLVNAGAKLLGSAALYFGYKASGRAAEVSLNAVNQAYYEKLLPPHVGYYPDVDSLLR